MRFRIRNGFLILSRERRIDMKKNWSEYTGNVIAWLGLNEEMDTGEIADWLEALALSGGCGFGSGDAFGDSSNSLATWISCLADKIREAHLPYRRNCDVGTVEEQSKRFRDFCNIESSASGGHCTGCRAICYGKNKCELAWAQMPYESSNGKGELDGNLQQIQD